MARIVQVYAAPSGSAQVVSTGSGYLTGLVASTSGSAATAVEVKENANGTPETVLKVYVPNGQPATVIQFVDVNQIKYTDGLEVVTNDAEVQMTLLEVK